MPHTTYSTTWCDCTLPGFVRFQSVAVCPQPCTCRAHSQSLGWAARTRRVSALSVRDVSAPSVRLHFVPHQKALWRAHHHFHHASNGAHGKQTYSVAYSAWRCSKTIVRSVKHLRDPKSQVYICTFQSNHHHAYIMLVTASDIPRSLKISERVHSACKASGCMCSCLVSR